MYLKGIHDVVLLSPLPLTSVNYHEESFKSIIEDKDAINVILPKIFL